MAHPDWAVKFRRPGTELRRITEKRYCLYECSSVYGKEKKRARKITGKYLGSITEEGGRVDKEGDAAGRGRRRSYYVIFWDFIV